MWMGQVNLEKITGNVVTQGFRVVTYLLVPLSCDTRVPSRDIPFSLENFQNFLVLPICHDTPYQCRDIKMFFRIYNAGYQVVT